VGLAMSEMNKRCGQESGNFTNLIKKYNKNSSDRELCESVNSSYLVYHDMKNFLLFGDPAFNLHCIGA
jgi:hypothetical protein